MRSRKTASQRRKESIRYQKEKVKRCGTCKNLFNGMCLSSNTVRHAIQSSCISYVEIVE